MAETTSYVGKPCPKCSYVRKATDVAPDWQCPKCGVAYAKFVQSQTATIPAGAAHNPYNAPRAAVGGAVAAEGGNGLAVLAHASVLIGFLVPLFSLIVPIVIWITKKDSDEHATSCAKEAINLQISIALWALLSMGLMLLAARLGPGPLWAGVGLLVILLIASIVLPIVAIVKASNGESWNYPFTLHLFS